MTTCPHCGAEFDAHALPPAETVPGPVDGRTTPRLIRVRLYQGGVDEPVADSDADLPADATGTWLVPGLPGVQDAVLQCARHQHPAPAHVTGLDKSDLARGIRGLRPTLSRRGGNAVWRLHYTVNDEAWMARVDVVTQN